jgi:microcystin-dependent protein
MFQDIDIAVVDGRSTFMLPDLRGRVPVGVSMGAGLTNVNLGQTRGMETTTLLLSNLPAAAPLTVNVAVTTDAGNSNSSAGGNTRLGASPSGSPTAANIWSATSANTVNLAGVSASGGLTGGGGVPINTLSPELGVNYCIAVQGVFLMRP